MYAVVAALHLPGIALLVMLLRDLADSDPPEAAGDGPSGGGGPRGWRWRRRPPRPGGRSQPARARRAVG
jgi:hypothetical protein